MKRKSKKKGNNGETTLKKTVEKLLENGDFVHYHLDHVPRPFWISYFMPLVDSKKIHQFVLPYLSVPFERLEDVEKLVPIEKISLETDPQKIMEKIMSGSLILQLEEEDEECAVIPIALHENRTVTTPEIEFSVEGPKEALVESLSTNINLIRKRLPDPRLTMKEMKVGKLSKTKVAIMYMEGKVKEKERDQIIERLNQMELDQVLDSSFILQFLEGNKLSPFPQFTNTERPDRVCGYLGEGKIVIFVDGSPFAVSGPTTLIEFFSSMEDYYLSWQIGTILRLIRYVAVTFSVLATPIYVAVLTYHYELIPKDMLSTLIGSRSKIPLPPILEAIFLELTIELLREAGARLPTKIGQTIGIVGGIVIGQASVEAGLTSNILLIIVALAALASFTTPVYRMGNTIRMIRFPFLLLAGIWGLIGIVISFLFVLVHLLRLESLGRPYLEPIFPPEFKYWKDSFVRLPFHMMSGKSRDNSGKRDPVSIKMEPEVKRDIDE